MLRRFSCVQLFATPWTVAHQDPLFVGILQAGMLGWFAMPSSKGPSWPRDLTHVSCIADGFFTWATGEARIRESVQFSSVAQSCPTLCNPMDCSTPGLPVHHQLSEFTQTRVHWVGDAIQPSHPSFPTITIMNFRIFSSSSKETPYPLSILDPATQYLLSLRQPLIYFLVL